MLPYPTWIFRHELLYEIGSESARQTVRGSGLALVRIGTYFFSARDFSTLPLPSSSVIQDQQAIVSAGFFEAREHHRGIAFVRSYVDRLLSLDCAT